MGKRIGQWLGSPRVESYMVQFKTMGGVRICNGNWSDKVICGKVAICKLENIMEGERWCIGAFHQAEEAR